MNTIIDEYDMFTLGQSLVPDPTWFENNPESIYFNAIKRMREDAIEILEDKVGEKFNYKGKKLIRLGWDSMFPYVDTEGLPNRYQWDVNGRAI